MILASPPSYLTAAEFAATALPADVRAFFAAQTSAAQQSILNSASGKADGIMKRSLLAQEVERQYIGDGSNSLNLVKRPLIYIRDMRFAQPGLTGYQIPTQSIGIDYVNAVLTTYTPIYLQDMVYSRFPPGSRINVRFAYGYGRVVQNPTWIGSDFVNAGLPALAAGQYDIAVTAAVPWGETSGIVWTFNTVTGQVLVRINPVLGVERYRIFVAPHGQQPMLVGEVPTLTFGDITPLQFIITTLAAPPDEFPEAMPTVDTSGHQLPAEIADAVRLLAIHSITSENNLANRGVAGDGVMKFGRGANAATNTPYLAEAKEQLRGYRFSLPQ